MSFANTLIVLSDRLDRLCRSGAISFLSLMLLLVIFQVVARYIFRAVPTWTEEAARYCMVWGGLLGATAAFKADKDPRMTNPPSGKSRLWVVCAFWLRASSTLIFLGPVLYFSDKFIIRTWFRTTEAMGIRTAFVTIAVPLAVVIIFFHLLVKIIQNCKGKN
ncbi:TRAP transporter small permease [Desulfobacula sp.]|uniref:TRAP transporter small permease n=1 Tax=Desulfobacula sp. TaxID=2593537 RepID=UPI001EC3E866|nr:TRAP transporter small permease subunit [Desulfobacula sp.]